MRYINMASGIESSITNDEDCSAIVSHNMKSDSYSHNSCYDQEADVSCVVDNDVLVYTSIMN